MESYSTYHIIFCFRLILFLTIS